MCKVTCERADDGEDNDVDESMDLGNGVHLENVGKFCYLGDMHAEWGWTSAARVRCARRKFKEFSGILTRKLGGVFKAEREGVCDVCEVCDGVWK